MKTKVVIEDGETEILLTPENDFEKDVLEKIHNKKQSFNFHINGRIYLVAAPLCNARCWMVSAQGPSPERPGCF